MDFRKLNSAQKKILWILPFTEKILDMLGGHEVYSFQDGFSGYCYIMITLEDKDKTTFITD